MLRPDNESTAIFFDQIQNVLRSPDSIAPEALSRILDFDCVVPNPSSDAFPEYVRRGSTYVYRMRTSIEHVRRQNTYVGSTRTCIVEICSHDMRTSGKYVRRWKTYVGRIRTSTNHVHQYNVAESRLSPEYVREENAYVTKNTYVDERRTSAEYVRTRQHLRICTHGCRSPRMRTLKLHLHGRSWNTMSSLRRQTDLETFANAAYNRPCSKRPLFRSRHAQANRRTYRITKITRIM